MLDAQIRNPGAPFAACSQHSNTPSLQYSVWLIYMVFEYEYE
jgi:hypothetical protein